MKRQYLTAREVGEILGVSESKSYSVIRKLNAELEKSGFLVVRGKVPAAYLQEKIYGGKSESCQEI